MDNITRVPPMKIGFYSEKESDSSIETKPSEISVVDSKNISDSDEIKDKIPSHNINSFTQKNSSKKEQSCSHCNNIFDSKTSYCNMCEKNNENKRNKEEFTFTCLNCHMTFNNRLTFFNHESIHLLTNGFFHCDFCEAFFDRKENIMKHRYEHYKEMCLGDNMKDVKSINFVTSNINYLTNGEEATNNFNPQTTFSLRDMKKKQLSSFKLVNLPRKSSGGIDKDKLNFASDSSQMIEGPNTTISKEGKKVIVFFCSQCKKTYNRQLLYEEHKRVHAGVKPFCCEICGRTFARESNLAGHRQSHRMSRIYKCKICKVRFSIKQKLVLHELMHELQEPFKCPLCIARFVREEEYLDHIKKHESDMPMGHNAQEQSFQVQLQPTIEEIILDENIIDDATESQVIYSNMEISDPMYNRNETFNTSISLLTNLTDKQNNSVDLSLKSSIKQENNEAVFIDKKMKLKNIIKEEKDSFNKKSRTDLKSKLLLDEGKDASDHLGLINQSGINSNLDNSSECFSFTRDHHKKNNMDNPFEINEVTHYLTPGGKIRPYIYCEICGQPYKLWREYEDHMRKHTGHKPFCCEVCGKTFHRSKNLSAHRYAHVKFKKYRCEVCGKSFPLRTRLKIHQRIHTGEKPYECEFCQQRFIRRNDYMDHRRQHTGGNTCSYCGKKYSKLETLREHINDVHKKIKPIKCKICDARFSYGVALYRHMKKHRGEEKDLNKKVHLCKFCSKAFTRPCLLAKHVDKAHPTTHPKEENTKKIKNH